MSGKELPEVYAAVTEDNVDNMGHGTHKEVIIRSRGETSEKAFENFMKIKGEVEKGDA